MDIGATLFPEYLPILLNDISSSCFVAIDFELSGLSFPPSAPQTKTQTVQERYAETKEAAERYQILQVGLTVCHEDPITAVYTMKPYNINLSPITQPETEVNRDWTFGSRSMEFLLSHNFSIDTMCSSGVRYLSRAEEKLAIERAIERCDSRSPIPNMDVQEDDIECLQFVASARLAINEWLGQGEKRQSWLNIPPPTSLPVAPSEVPNGLSNAQKRLVHQLISVEYPSLTSRGAPSFVQIEVRNQEAEKKFLASRLQVRKDYIRSNVGFRWIVEALVGGDLDELDPKAFSPLMNKFEHPAFDIKQLADRVKGKLKQNRPVLVGHNIFCDLLFFYRCFICPLPNILEEFVAAIHNLFPVVADTKYLATYDCGVLAPESSLEDLNRNLAHFETPKIEIDPRFTKYKYRKSTHEAGYDSLLAAMAFIKLAGNIQRNPALFPRKGGQQPRVISGLRTPPSLANRGYLIPRLGTVFWAHYGDRLRVFGTQEKMIQLKPQPKVDVLVEV